DMGQGHRERLRMEVPSAHARSLLENERVVRRGVHLDPQGRRRIFEGGPDGPEDLGYAPQRVWILHLVRTLVGGDDLAPPQQTSEVRRDLPRARLRLQP